MSLNVELRGKGPAVVLLHGWGLNAGVFEELAAALSTRNTVHLVDFPGHGHAAADPFVTMDELVDALADAIAEPALVTGWSMGGLVAQRLAARHPAKVRSLALVSTTPCFVSHVDWAHGVAAEVLEAFAADLRHDVAATLSRFLHLNVDAGASGRGVVRALAARLAARGYPSPAALDAALELLRTTDLRAQAATLAMPAVVIHGSRDRVVPAAAGRWLADALPHAELVELPSSAHLPFVSEPAAVLNALEALRG